MGLLDSIQTGFNKGVASTGRATRSLQIKSHLSTLDKQRVEQMAQLGASLYEETRNNPAVRGPREQIYATVEALDAERSTLHAELAQIEMESQQQQMASQQILCPGCGKAIPATSKFCVGCGASIEYAPAPALAGNCVNCGAPLTAGAGFCTGCGTPVGAQPAAAPVDTPVATPAPVDMQAAAPADMPVAVPAETPVYTDEAPAPEANNN